ncbi:MAG: 2-hydroxyacyl-CoA dehydratase subunit D [Promethearchaeota archaeon]
MARENARPVVGCLPLYPPVEFLHSMGTSPVVFWGVPQDTSEADKHLQSFTCAVARYLLGNLLTSNPAPVDAIFSYNACDTIRNLPEIILEGLPRPVPSFRFHLPVAPREQTDSRGYFKSEVEGLVGQLEEFTGNSFSSATFRASVELYRRARGLVAEIGRRVARGESSFNELAGAAARAEPLEVEGRIHLLESVLEESPTQPRPAGGDMGGRVGILLSGIVPPSPGVVDAVESSGAVVVGNDIASLSRSHARTPETTGDPVAYYEQFYYEHVPCPTLPYTGDARLGYLKSLVEESGAEGVVFLGEKFCEYEYFEHPYLRDQLGVPSLVLETGLRGDEQVAAVRNRVEAFVEVIENGRQ